jgi:PTH1 family peptidyl-tRNA hydrolase
VHRFLIAGLGNPGEKYRYTRHNMGFMVLDKIASDLGLSFRHESRSPKFASADTRIDGSRVIFMKPLEYMNRSGPPVARVVSYYKILPENTLIVHDDLDIGLGRIKFVRSGGAGGHNGIRSIIEALGTKSFPRLKIGIDRPPPEIPGERYVLGRFSPEHRELVEKVVEMASEALLVFVRHGIQEAMNRFNGVAIS